MKLLPSSGSTGLPKLVVITEAMIRPAAAAQGPARQSVAQSAPIVLAYEAMRQSHDVLMQGGAIGLFSGSLGRLLEDAQIARIKDIPTVIVQGRYDVVCPATSAWELHRKLPGSTLHVTTTGHSAFEPEIVERLVEATDGFRGLS